MSEVTKIPLFPLHLFLLPGEKTQLHIFEERYKELINHCMEETNVFGIACNAHENSYNLGSMVRISKVIKRYNNGEMDIEVTCFGLFRLKKFFYRLEHVPWPGGYVEAWNNPLLIIPYEPDETEYALIDNPALSAAIGLQMSIGDKLKFAAITEQEDQHEFIDSRKRLMTLLKEQEEARFEKSIYLN